MLLYLRPPKKSEQTSIHFSEQTFGTVLLYYHCTHTSSQGSESINSWAKGRVGNDDGNGYYARYKHPLLMVLTLYNGYLSMARNNFRKLNIHKRVKSGRVKSVYFLPISLIIIIYIFIIYIYIFQLLFTKR